MNYKYELQICIYVNIRTGSPNVRSRPPAVALYVRHPVCVRNHICICVYIPVCTRIYVYIYYIYICICTHVYIRTSSRNAHSQPPATAPSERHAMCTRINICIRVYIYVYTRICVCIYMHISYIYTCVYMYISQRVVAMRAYGHQSPRHLSEIPCVRAYVCMYVCVHIHIYVNVHIYIYKYHIHVHICIFMRSTTGTRNAHSRPPTVALSARHPVCVCMNICM